MNTPVNIEMGGSGGISRFFLPSMDSLRSVNSITFVRAQSAFFFRTGASLRGVLITLQLILYDCAGSILCIEPGRTEQLLVTHNDCTGSIMPSFRPYAVPSAFTAPLPTLSGRGSRRRQSGHSQVTVRSQSGHSQVYSQVSFRSCKNQDKVVISEFKEK